MPKSKSMATHKWGGVYTKWLSKRSKKAEEEDGGQAQAMQAQEISGQFHMEGKQSTGKDYLDMHGLHVEQ